MTPNFWTDPKTGINYPVAIQTPQHLVDSVDALLSHFARRQRIRRIRNSSAMSSRSSAAKHRRSSAITTSSRCSTSTPTCRARDLGRVSDQVTKIVDEFRPKLPPGNTIIVRGQVESMNTAFSKLGLGLIFAAALIYFLMVVNFQSLDSIRSSSSWRCPARSRASCGCSSSPHTTFNVESMMGAIMSVGVATANSILMITFANEQLREGKTALDAALTAGHIRLRPVLMTALAMIIGMVPMSLGLGEGGEQNAPLGRAVIGGLSLATVATLFFVPVVFSVIRRQTRPREMDDDPDLIDRQLEPATQH